jgi:hypothetical protein
MRACFFGVHRTGWELKKKVKKEKEGKKVDQVSESLLDAVQERFRSDVDSA